MDHGQTKLVSNLRRGRTLFMSSFTRRCPTCHVLLFISLLSLVYTRGLVLAEGVGRKEEGRPRSWLPQCSLEADLLSDSGHVQSRHQLYLASRGEHGLARRRPSRGDMREHASAPPSLGSRCLASRSPWWPQHRRRRMLNLLRQRKLALGSLPIPNEQKGRHFSWRGDPNERFYWANLG
jgi:hypothetical protein